MRLHAGLSDLKPLIDAVEYATKYATKAEKSSVSADAMFNDE